MIACKSHVDLTAPKKKISFCFVLSYHFSVINKVFRQRHYQNQSLILSTLGRSNVHPLSVNDPPTFVLILNGFQNIGILENTLSTGLSKFHITSVFTYFTSIIVGYIL